METTMDLLMTLGDIDSIDDDFVMDDATEMHENVSFVDEVPANVTTGIVCFNDRNRDARPYKVIDSCTGRYLRGFASKEEALDFARNPHMYATKQKDAPVASRWSKAPQQRAAERISTIRMIPTARHMERLSA